jgi:hypothetical protein
MQAERRFTLRPTTALHKVLLTSLLVVVKTIRSTSPPDCGSIRRRPSPAWDADLSPSPLLVKFRSDQSRFLQMAPVAPAFGIIFLLDSVFFIPYTFLIKKKILNNFSRTQTDPRPFGNQQPLSVEGSNREMPEMPG